MTSLSLLIALACLFVLVSTEKCTQSSWDGFSKKGFTTCPHNNQYIKGFERSRMVHYKSWFRKKIKDPITHLRKATCCHNTAKAYSKDNAICQPGNWVNDFKSSGWAYCPNGYFLQGLYQNGGKYLYNIHYGRCCRPWGHPLKYTSCYVQSIDHNKKFIGCLKADHYIVGMKRSAEKKLKGLEQFKCCKLMKRRPPPTSLDDVKQYIMDRTRLDLVWLADYLGYAWCRGCGSVYTGDDFKRVGNSWEAGTRGEVCGSARDKRLKIVYKGFKLLTAGKTVWGKKVRQTMPPYEIDSGKVTNNDAHPTTTVIDKVEEFTRTVSHVVSQQWKKTHETGVDLAGLLVGFTCHGAGAIGARFSYKFKYEDSTTTTDSKQSSDVKKFKILTKKTIPGNTSTRWRIMMTKTRTTIPYTARVLAHFPVEFEGLLRSKTNFHYKHRGRNERPFFKYQLGDDRRPFCHALKEMSSKNMAPWEWSKMEQKNPEVHNIIARLIDKNTYLFTVSGQIEDVVGTRVEIQWSSGNKPWPKPYKRDIPGDLPRIYPPAPEIDIFTEGEPITEDVEEFE